MVNKDSKKISEVLRHEFWRRND